MVDELTSVTGSRATVALVFWVDVFVGVSGVIDRCSPGGEIVERERQSMRLTEDNNSRYDSFVLTPFSAMIRFVFFGLRLGVIGVSQIILGELSEVSNASLRLATKRGRRLNSSLLIPCLVLREELCCKPVEKTSSCMSNVIMRERPGARVETRR